MSKIFGRAVPPAFVSLITVAGFVMSASDAAAAQLTYTAQTRTVEAKAYTGTTQSAGAPDYAQFDTAVTSTGTAAGNTATATQRSQLLPTQITFSSNASGTRTSNSPADNIMGRAVLDTTFTLDASSAYDSQITATSPTSANGYCYMNLIDLSTNTSVFTRTLTAFAGPPTATSGTLAAGSYRLVITHNNETLTGSLAFSSGFNASLAVPEPASAGLLIAAAGLLSRRRRRSP